MMFKHVCTYLQKLVQLYMYLLLVYYIFQPDTNKADIGYFQQLHDMIIGCTYNF